MKTIEIEDEVFRVLESKVKGFGVTPNDVLKQLLFESKSVLPKSAKNGEAEKAHPLQELVSSPEFLTGKVKDRYFAVLRFLCSDKPQEFAKLNGFRRGSRIQLSTDKNIIENSGQNTFPQKLEGTPYWVLTNLSTQRIRVILNDILHLLRYDSSLIASVIRAIPDSGISRRRERLFDVCGTT